LQGAKSSHTLLWTVPECPYLVTIPATVLDEIRLSVVEAYYSVPRGGVEVGGVLFGVRVGDSLHIQAHRSIRCQYLTGPSFRLSADDKTDLAGVLKLPESYPKLANLTAIGWYHSHHRSEIFLSPEDLQLYGEFFPERWQIALVLRPAHMRPTRAGFFFRDLLGAIQSDAPVQEFITEPPSYGLTLLDPEAENALASTLAAGPLRTNIHGDLRDVLTVVSPVASSAAPGAPATNRPAAPGEEGGADRAVFKDVPAVDGDLRDVLTVVSPVASSAAPGAPATNRPAAAEEEGWTDRAVFKDAPAVGGDLRDVLTVVSPAASSAAPGAPSINRPAAPGEEGGADRAVFKKKPEIQSPAKPGIKRGADPEVPPPAELAHLDIAEAEPDTPEAKLQDSFHTQSVEAVTKHESLRGVRWDKGWLRTFRKLMVSSERRSARRESGDGLIAFFWEGDLPRAHRVKDISRQGAYIETEFSWPPGTLILLTLQNACTGGDAESSTDAIVVTAEIVRTSQDGMGLKFLPSDFEEMCKLLQFLARWNPTSVSPIGDNETPSTR
jgi:proteasome lid subunit RPN8/RPN11